MRCRVGYGSPVTFKMTLFVTTFNSLHLLANLHKELHLRCFIRLELNIVKFIVRTLPLENWELNNFSEGLYGRDLRQIGILTGNWHFRWGWFFFRWDLKTPCIKNSEYESQKKKKRFRLYLHANIYFFVGANFFFFVSSSYNQFYHILRLFDILQIFLSPQEKRCAIITYKHGIYELPNNLRLRILGT